MSNKEDAKIDKNDFEDFKDDVSEDKLPLFQGDSTAKEHAMTESYTEISQSSSISPARRPSQLNLKCEALSEKHKVLEYLDQLEGVVRQEGDMVTFVAEDLETKIKLSSPPARKEGLVLRGWPLKPLMDNPILNELELEASRIASSVDTLTENLAGILHSVSALTVDCLDTYRDVVCKTCDAVDLNIKSTYQLMAKCEELGKEMQPVYALSSQIKEIKRLLDLLENAANIS